MSHRRKSRKSPARRARQRLVQLAASGIPDQQVPQRTFLITDLREWEIQHRLAEGRVPTHHPCAPRGYYGGPADDFFHVEDAL